MNMWDGDVRCSWWQVVKHSILHRDLNHLLNLTRMAHLSDFYNLIKTIDQGPSICYNTIDLRDNSYSINKKVV